MGRILRGRFERPGELFGWIALGYGGALVLAIVSIALYPEGNEFHLLRTCVSKLGSPEPQYNPTGFVYFSAAMVLISATSVPLVLFRHAKLTAALGPMHRIRLLTGAILLGTAGGIVSGLFPMSREVFAGAVTLDDIHDVGAKMAFYLFGGGMLVDALPIVRQALGHRRGRPAKLDYRRLRWPYIVWALIGTCAVFFLLAWDLKRAADPTLLWTGEGIYSFALWEWVMTAALPIVTAWVALAWFYDRGPPDPISR